MSLSISLLHFVVLHNLHHQVINDAAKGRHSDPMHIEDYLVSENVEANEAPLTIRGERKRLWDNMTLAAAQIAPTLDNQGLL